MTKVVGSLFAKKMQYHMFQEVGKLRGEKAEVTAEAIDGNLDGALGVPNVDKISSSQTEVTLDRLTTSLTTISAICHAISSLNFSTSSLVMIFLTALEILFFMLGIVLDNTCLRETSGGRSKDETYLPKLSIWPMLVIMLVVRFHRKSGSDDLSRKSGLLDRRFCLLEAEAKRVFFVEIEGCCCDEDKVSDEHVVVILEPDAERCLAVADEVDV